MDNNVENLLASLSEQGVDEKILNNPTIQKYIRSLYDIKSVSGISIEKVISNISFVLEVSFKSFIKPTRYFGFSLVENKYTDDIVYGRVKKIYSDSDYMALDPREYKQYAFTSNAFLTAPVERSKAKQ